MCSQSKKAKPWTLLVGYGGKVGVHCECLKNFYNIDIYKVKILNFNTIYFSY